jgi:hypothetical protein
LIKHDALSEARRARRQSRTNSATTSGDETRRTGCFMFQDKNSVLLLINF